MEAQRGGADRVELCENMADGGCTPSAGTIQLARTYLKISLFVMIRPRGADFLYSDDEFEIMQQDILMAKKLGADGVVFGILTSDGRIDGRRMEELVKLSRPMGITCHRAFDMTRDPFEALDDLMALGVDRILTSGQAGNALEGAPLIRKLITQSKGRILLMPGRGIKEHNLTAVIRETGAVEFHLYLTNPVKSRMTFLREGLWMGNPDQSEFEHIQVDATRVAQAREILDNFKNGNL
ncbi:MAG: copper homeostasis protein CutC [Bacteroidales bacterium]|nr:copper homeostasis protein CutC [Bacteroidales bacterium]